MELWWWDEKQNEIIVRPMEKWVVHTVLEILTVSQLSSCFDPQVLIFSNVVYNVRMMASCSQTPEVPSQEQYG